MDKITGVDCLPSGRFDSEPELDLDEYYVKPDDSFKKISDFMGRFDPCLMSVTGEVPMQHFVNLQNDTKIAAESEGELNENEYVTAFRVTLGITNNEIELFCEPLYLEVYKYTGSRVKAFVRELDNQPCYRVLEGQLNPVTSINHKKNSQKRYRKSIRIRHFRNSSPEPFNEGSKWKHDTKSIIFSFQELFCLYHTNHGLGTNPNPDYTKMVTLANAASFKGKGPINRRRYKHTIIIRTGTNESQKSLSPDRGDDGNLGHLCPPSKNCEEIEFP